MLGYVLIGMIAGLVGLFTTVLLGRSLISALFAYMAVGTVATLLVPTLMLALRRVQQPAEGDGSARDMDLGTGDECAATGDPRLPAADAAADSMQILAVDDNPFILELIPKIAAKAGFSNVATAAHAEDALNLLARTPAAFGCILLDIDMPGMNGIDLCARIREIPGYRSTPIIMLTAMSDTSYLDRAFKAGATDYTTKPFDVIEFGSRLRAAKALLVANGCEDGKERTLLDGSNRPPAALVAQKPGLPDRVQIEGISNFIDLNSLSNYLTRLSGRKLVRSVVVAVQTRQIEDVHASLSATAFQKRLQRIAEGIDVVFAPDGYVAAYAGRGQFVLLCDMNLVPQLADREADLLDHFKRDDPGSDPALADCPQLLIGAAVRPRTARENRARDAIGTALDLAEERATTMPDARLSFPDSIRR